MKKYCSETTQVWCADEINDFNTEIDKFRKFKGKAEIDIIDHMDLMSEFANQKYEHFRNIWTEYDDLSFWIGILMSLWLFLFHQFTMFGRSEEIQDMAGITGMGVNWFTYIGAVVFGFYPLWVSALAAFCITFG